MCWDDPMTNTDANWVLNNTDLGMVIGEAAGEFINEHYSVDAPAKVAMINYPQPKILLEREQGIRQGLEETCPGKYEIIFSQPSLDAKEAQDAMEVILQAEPDCKIVVGIGSGAMISSDEALQISTGGDIPEDMGVFTADVTKQQLEQLKDPTYPARAVIGFEDVWSAYFEELDPQKRLELLKNLPGSEDEAGAFCRQLYQQRYTDPKRKDRQVDTWLWKFVYLPGLFKRRKLLTRALHREMQGTVRELHLEHPEILSETEKTVLYQEFRNAARRYLSTCKGDHYGRGLFGMKKATDQERADKACEDIWFASRGLACISGLEENLRLWCDALYDELLDYDPGNRKHYDELELRIQK